MRKRDLERCRRVLLEQRERILGNVDRVLSGELDIDPDDFADQIDTAVAESSLSFAGRIRERERRLLNKIEKALETIDQGTYGRALLTNARRFRCPSTCFSTHGETAGSASGASGAPIAVFRSGDPWEVRGLAPARPAE